MTFWYESQNQIKWLRRDGKHPLYWRASDDWFSIRMEDRAVKQGSTYFYEALPIVFDNSIDAIELWYAEGGSMGFEDMAC